MVSVTLSGFTFEGSAVSKLRLMRCGMLVVLMTSCVISAFCQACKTEAFDKEYKAASSIVFGDYQKALAASKSLVNRYAGTNSWCEGRSLQLFANVIWSNGEYDESVATLRKARRLVMTESDEMSAAGIDMLMGDNYYYQAYYDSAIKYYKAGIHIYEKLGNKYDLMNSLHRIALMYNRKGDMKNTLHYLYKSEELKDTSRGQSNELADLLGKASFFNDSLFYLTKIGDELNQLTTFRKEGNEKGEYSTLLNLGIANRKLGKHLEAARYLVKGSRVMASLGYFPTWSSVGREYGEAGMKDSCFYFHYLAKAEVPWSTRIKNIIVMEFLGDSHALFNNLDSAAWYMERSYEMNTRMNNRISMPVSANRLAQVYFRMGKNHRAEELLLQGIRQAEGTSRQHMLSLYEFGKTFYAATGNPLKALEYADKAMVLSDSINTMEGAMALVYYQAQFETVRKERELESARVIVRNRTITLVSLAAVTLLSIGFVVSLFLQRRKIQRQNRELQESNAEQKALTQEVHHRVKNNLQYIVSLLSLQAQNVDSPELEQQIEEIKTRIMTMGLIHQRLYQAQGIQAVFLPSFLNELVENLMSVLSSRVPVVKHMKIDPVRVDVESAIALGLLINELTTNAIKHAFANHPSPVFHLDVVRDHDKITFDVTDNGPGYNLALSAGRGFGVRLIELLLRKLKGSMQQKSPNTIHVEVTGITMVE